MNCSYILSEREVIRAMQLHGKGSRKSLVILVLAGALLFAIGFSSGHKILSAVGLIGGISGYYCVLLLLIPINAKKQYKQNRAVRNEISMQMEGQGITFKSESGESRLQWRDIHKWKFASGIYILYITNNMFHIVPAKALPNEHLFSDSLTGNVGPAKA